MRRSAHWGSVEPVQGGLHGAGAGIGLGADDDPDGEMGPHGGSGGEGLDQDVYVLDEGMRGRPALRIGD
ncbi:hypothetical protein ACLBX9_14525 [Methylobacterium sp. A49B]